MRCEYCNRRAVYILTVSKNNHTTSIPVCKEHVLQHDPAEQASVHIAAIAEA